MNHVSVHLFFSLGVCILWGNKLTSYKPAPNHPEKFVLIFTESAMAKRASMCFHLGIMRKDLSSKRVVHLFDWPHLANDICAKGIVAMKDCG